MQPKLLMSWQTLLVGAALALLASSSSAQRTTLYVYGDSWTDVGNVFAATNGGAPSPSLYYQGRFTNGLGNWVDYINDTNVVDVVDLAWGGASVCQYTIPSTNILSTIPRVGQQVQTFKDSSSTAPPNRVHVLLGGLNDIVLYPKQLSIPINAAATADCVIQSAEVLLAAGEKAVVIGTIPPAQLFPKIYADENAAMRASWQQAINSVNAAIYARVFSLWTKYPDATIGIWDVNIVTTIMTQHCEDLGFTNCDQSCLQSSTGPVFVLSPPADTTICANPDSYVYYDPLHLSSQGFKLLAQSLSLSLQLLRLTSQPIV